jgi:hypothetical protein
LAKRNKGFDAKRIIFMPLTRKLALYNAFPATGGGFRVLSLIIPLILSPIIIRSSHEFNR